MSQTKTNEAFREYVTSTSFSLTLSRNMITVLMSIRAGLFIMSTDLLRARGMYDTAVPSARALLERGLIERDAATIYRLTKAGKLTCELLQEAGFMLPQPEKELASL